MIKGILRNRRVLIENEADASTLRNKGYKGKNLGQMLSLDLVSSIDLLLRKKMTVTRGKTCVTTEQVQEMLSADERKTAIAFHFLKVKGMRPITKRLRLYSADKPVTVFWDSDFVEFAVMKRKNNTMAVVDHEGSCLLYSVNEIGRVDRARKVVGPGNVVSKEEDILVHFRAKGLRIESGLKFGSEFRVYEGNSSHAKYLMTIGEKSIARDLVARVRVSQSVRKTYLQVAPDPKLKKYRLFEIKWIRR